VVLKETCSDFEEDSGDHMAIYIGDIEGCFHRAQELGVAWVNPRFPNLDGQACSMENTRQFHQFRVRELRNESGELIHIQEHEVTQCLSSHGV